MEIEKIRRRVANGQYLIKSHTIRHALKEGFERRNIVEAIFNGKVIEDYLQEQRSLICGITNLTDEISIYLHVVCEYADVVYIEFVTAYIPEEDIWESPPFKRRR